MSHAGNSKDSLSLILIRIYKLPLALGTAQFGGAYGISNTVGQISPVEIENIIKYASASGFSMIDTAISYGESEVRLGDVGVSNWRVISKLPIVPEYGEKVYSWIANAVEGSIGRLKINRLYALLLHNPQQLLGPDGDNIYQALIQLKLEGYVEKIGISIYDPVDLVQLCNRYHFDLIQAPFNLLDHRLIDGGWLQRLKLAGVEIHVRSIFLQGLLLMESAARPRRFDRWAEIWRAQDAWMKHHNITPLEACTRYALSFPEIDQVVIGVESVRQLKEILASLEGALPKIPAAFSGADIDLINPSRWSTL